MRGWPQHRALGAAMTRSRRSTALVAASVTASVVFISLLIFGHATLDLGVYVMGARHLFDGRLYDVRGSAAPHLPFTYPPFAALVFTPFVPLPYVLAQVVWGATSLAALVGIIATSIWAVRPQLPARSIWTWALLLLAPVLAFEPIYENFYFLQVNLVLDLAILLDLLVVLRVRGRTVPRGVLIGIAAALKLTPLVFVGFLFATRQFRAGVTALATFAACTVIGSLCNVHAAWSFWTRYAFDAKRVGGVTYLSNQSLRGALDRLAGELVSMPLVTALEAALLVAGLALAAWAWHTSSALLGVLVAATTGLLVSPITWTHHLVWLVPALLWLVLGKDRPWGGPWWAALAAVVFWLGLVWFAPDVPYAEVHERGLTLVVANSYWLLLVGFLVGVAVMLTARSRRSRRVAPLAPTTVP